MTASPASIVALQHIDRVAWIVEVRQAIIAVGHNKSAAARLLDVSIKTLRKWCKEDKSICRGLPMRGNGSVPGQANKIGPTAKGQDTVARVREGLDRGDSTRDIAKAIGRCPEYVRQIASKVRLGGSGTTWLALKDGGR